MADTRDWVNQSQPQTLVIACFLLYVNAAFGILFSIGQSGLFLALTLAFAGAQVMAGRGIAQERKWGYILGIAMAFAPFVIRTLLLGSPFKGVGIIGLMFEIALVALLLHPQSRDYKKIWFK
jgi:hypothetical protein